MNEKDEGHSVKYINIIHVCFIGVYIIICASFFLNFCYSNRQMCVRFTGRSRSLCADNGSHSIASQPPPIESLHTKPAQMFSRREVRSKNICLRKNNETRIIEIFFTPHKIKFIFFKKRSTSEDDTCPVFKTFYTST